MINLIEFTFSPYCFLFVIILGIIARFIIWVSRIIFLPIVECLPKANNFDEFMQNINTLSWNVAINSHLNQEENDLITNYKIAQKIIYSDKDK